MLDYITLRGKAQRQLAKMRVDAAPADAVVTIKAATRTLDQNAKMWAMLGDLCREKPEGRNWTQDVWKSAFMHFLGHEILWEQGLNGEPFPRGFRTSRLNKSQMADLITVIQEYGDRHGVRWTDEARGWAA